MMRSTKNPAAVEIGRRGGSAGTPAQRAARLETIKAATKASAAARRKPGPRCDRCDRPLHEGLCRRCDWKKIRAKEQG